MTGTTPRLREKGHKSQGHSRDSDVWGSKLIFCDVKTKTYTFLFQVIIQRVWAHGEGSSSGNGINKDATPLDQTLWGGGRDPWATWRRSITSRRLQQLQCWPWPGAPSARMARKTGLHGVPPSGLHGEATSVLRPSLDRLCPPPSPSSELWSCHLNNTCKPILRAPPGQLAHRQTWPSCSAEVQSHVCWRLRFCTQLLQLATSTFFFCTFPHPKPPSSTLWIHRSTFEIIHMSPQPPLPLAYSSTRLRWTSLTQRTIFWPPKSGLVRSHTLYMPHDISHTQGIFKTQPWGLTWLQCSETEALCVYVFLQISCKLEKELCLIYLCTPHVWSGEVSWVI